MALVAYSSGKASAGGRKRKYGRRRRSFGKKRARTTVARIARRAVRREFNRHVETKEGQWKSPLNFSCLHNNIIVIQASGGGNLNPFATSAFGANDPMVAGQFVRIGDQITVKGLKIVGFFENSLERAKVYYRLMLLKCPRGQTIDKTTLFKGDSDNKMIDVINTETFTVVAQKVFNIECSNNAPTTVGLTGVPAGGTPAGTGSRVIKMWIPGNAFGKGGVIKYENGASTPKFFDYRLVLLTYDWYGTPETNAVGRVNELYTKVYFKDA